MQTATIKIKENGDNGVSVMVEFEPMIDSNSTNPVARAVVAMLNGLNGAIAKEE